MRRQPEGGALDHGHTLAFQEVGHEIKVGFDRLTRRRLFADRAGTGWKDVKGTFRYRASQALALVQGRDRQVAAGLEDLVMICDEGLRAVQGFDRRRPAD